MTAFEIQDLFLILIAVFATSALFNLVLFFGYHRQISYLFFAFFCGFHIFKVWLKTFPEDQIMITGTSITAFDLIYVSVVLGLISLNVFLAYYHDLAWKRMFFLLFSLASVICFFAVSEPIYIFCGVVVAVVQTVPFVQKEPTSILLIVGLITLFILSVLGFSGILPYGYFFGIILLILLMMLATGMRLSRQMKDLNEARLRSSQLQNQLLKKTIQPHFILNSLTSLQELIECQPEKATQFIQDLSDEFRLFAKVSEQKLIEVKDELALIRGYIGIMSARLDKVFHLQCYGLDLNEHIPPGLLLTLVENGILHGYADKQEGYFTITETNDRDGRVLKIKNDGAPPKEPIVEGLGLTYIRSRLEEVFPGRYEIELESQDNGFQTVIKIAS